MANLMKEDEDGGKEARSGDVMNPTRQKPILSFVDGQ
jgi:hypothetical protein